MLNKRKLANLRMRVRAKKVMNRIRRKKVKKQLKPSEKQVGKKVMVQSEVMIQTSGDF